MIISQKIEKYNKNRIESIKKMSNGYEKDYSIGALIADLGKRCIRQVCKIIGICYRKAKKCYDIFLNIYIKPTVELRGRKKIIEKYPNLKKDIEKVIEKYKSADSHFKTERLYVNINPTAIINELIKNYNYPNKFACYNTIHKLLNKMGYNLHRIPKDKVVKKIPETNIIFANVNKELEYVSNSNDNTIAISLDDKASKKIGELSDNGKTWLKDIRGLDHDTIYNCTIKPFGILDLKTNETFVTCTKSSSTAEFKVDCIEEYLKYKLEKNKNINILMIFLDNGPENSGKRKLWLKKLTELSEKYSILIKLIYYPPYHSKYNKIERYWARLQMTWNKIIINSEEYLIDVINMVTWKGIKSKARMSYKRYKKGKEISREEMKIVDKHILRDETLKKWSIAITPFEN